MVELKSTKLSQIAVHLLDLFYLPFIHQYTNLFLAAMLESLTTNEYINKDSFIFAVELQSFDSKLVIASFDIDSRFTKIPLQEPINLFIKNLFKDRTHVDKVLKGSFQELLLTTMSESLILFYQEFCKQHDEVAMVSPLEPTLVNVFLFYHEKIFLKITVTLKVFLIFILKST